MHTPSRRLLVQMFLMFGLLLSGSCLSETNDPSTNVPVGAVLTPKQSANPRITGARVFGVRPGNPFLFTVTATGKRPMTFSAENLPAGLSLDSETGRITGVLSEKGETAVILHAKNALGKTKRNFRIVCGDTIALTPPLGWNSWNCFAGAVDDGKVRSAADAMVSSGLIDHGWTYINIDDCWEAARDTNGMILSNQKFPDMKALGEYIHSKGLKFGIYSSPGPKTCAGFTASYQHEDKDAEQYGNWGVDYVKYDWCSFRDIANKLRIEKYSALLPDYSANIKTVGEEKATLEAIYWKTRTAQQNARLKEVNKEWNDLLAKAKPEDKARVELEIMQEPYSVFRKSLDKVNRDIVFSYCQYGMGDVWKWGEKLGGNSWRTTGDITDTWKSMRGIGFSQAGHEPYAGPGHWNDPDMLVVGRLGWGKLHPTRLTPDEQYTHISLWSLLAAPLLIGCDMTQLDDFTKGLLSNDEVIDVNQDPLGKQASRVTSNGDLQVWARDLEDGSKAVGLFNTGEKEAKVTADWKDLGLAGNQIVRDLWRQKDIGSFSGKFDSTVPSHGVVLLRIRPDSKKQ